MQHLQHTSDDRWNTWNMHLKHLQKQLKNTWSYCKHMQYLDENTCNIYVKHMQHPDKRICNIHMKKQMKHWEHKLATYVYNHCDIYNILIYFCNTYETSETLETYGLQHGRGRGRSIPADDEPWRVSTTNTSTVSGTQAPSPPSPPAPGLARPGERRVQWKGAGDAYDEQSEHH
jgi:hypothetical protein